MPLRLLDGCPDHSQDGASLGGSWWFLFVAKGDLSLAHQDCYQAKLLLGSVLPCRLSLGTARFAIWSSDEVDEMELASVGSLMADEVGDEGL